MSSTRCLVHRKVSQTRTPNPCSFRFALAYHRAASIKKWRCWLAAKCFFFFCFSSSKKNNKIELNIFRCLMAYPRTPYTHSHMPIAWPNALYFFFFFFSVCSPKMVCSYITYPIRCLPMSVYVCTNIQILSPKSRGDLLSRSTIFLLYELVVRHCPYPRLFLSAGDLVYIF